MRPLLSILVLLLAALLASSASVRADSTRFNVRPALLATADGEQNFIEVRGRGRGGGHDDYRSGRHDSHGHFFNHRGHRDDFRFRNHFLFDHRLRFDDHRSRFRSQVCLKQGAVLVCVNNFSGRGHHY